MQPQIIVAGHICLDLIPHLSGPADVRPGHLQTIGPVSVSTGGAVANTGLALNRLGVPVRLMGKVGNDLFGGAILNVLREHASHLADAMIVTPGDVTSYSIVISPPGTDRSFLHCPGANDTFAEADVRDDQLTGAKIFHFGYPPLMKRMYEHGGAELARLFQRAQSAGLVTSLDLAKPDPTSAAGQVDWPTLLDVVLPNVDVFQPSIDEIQWMLGNAGEPIGRQHLQELAGQLLNAGAGVVAIKLGERGLYVRTSPRSERIERFCRLLSLESNEWTDREMLSPCFQATQVVGTTGAGDCTIAGFLAAMLRSETPANAATSATAVGAASVESADATSGVTRWSEIEARVKRAWARLPSFADEMHDATITDQGTIVFR